MLCWLQSLTALTHLDLAHVSPSAVHQLTALSRLQSMCLYFEGQAAFGLHHLVPFTALTALTQLYCAMVDEQQAEEAEDVRDDARDLVFLQDDVRGSLATAVWVVSLTASSCAVLGTSTCTVPCWSHTGCVTCVCTHRHQQRQLLPCQLLPGPETPGM